MSQGYTLQEIMQERSMRVANARAHPYVYWRCEKCEGCKRTAREEQIIQMDCVSCNRAMQWSYHQLI